MSSASLVLIGSLLLAAAGPANPGRPADIVLKGDGLIVAGRTLSFERTSRGDAIAAVTAVLGRPVETGNQGDCGGGVDIFHAKFKGDFELSFVKGRLSGWTEDARTFATDRGIRVEDTVAALKKAYPDVYLDKGNEAEGGVGPSFQREGGPNGWLSGLKRTSRIGGLFAGATCLPGI